MRKLVLPLLLSAALLSGCSEAGKANANASWEADSFNRERRITVYNAWADSVVFDVEGFMSITNNEAGELIVTCKVGENEFKKSYISLNEYTMYVVEDITRMHDDPYHYRMYFHDAPSGFGTKP